jgi:hypothetical protein
MTPPVRLRPGTRVRVDARAVEHHCRTPRYLRGRLGRVVAHLGAFGDPETLAYHRPGALRNLYQVEFEHAELWTPGEAGVVIAADLYEHWLNVEDD